MSASEIERMQQLKEQGWSNVAVAKELGCSHQAVSRWMRRPAIRRRSQRDPERAQRIAALLRQGKKSAWIMRREKCSASYVSFIRRQLSMEAPKRPRAARKNVPAQKRLAGPMSPPPEGLQDVYIALAREILQLESIPIEHRSEIVRFLLQKV